MVPLMPLVCPDAMTRFLVEGRRCEALVAISRLRMFLYEYCTVYTMCLYSINDCDNC